VNHDGLLDVITSDYGGSSLSVLLGNGLGGFASASNFSTGSNPFYIAVADFNADGLTDLAVANVGAENVTLLTNTLGACVTTVSPAAKTLISSGGTVNVTVSAPAGCGWAALSKQTWLTVPFGSFGTGNGTTEVTVAPNYEASRSGTVSVGKKSLKITQN
jgi:hypothetical protein